MIKHLVIGGGGAGGYSVYGAMKYLSKKEYWDIKNIESIYSTSIGAYLAIMISLGYNWDWLDDYLIKRPWEKVIPFKPEQIANFWNNKGILDENIASLILGPLLVAKELTNETTLQELYNHNNIAIHIYATNLNANVPTKIDISYKTHPDLLVCKAVAMSSAIPMLFTPVFDASNCYIDGGFLNNFPLDSCIENVENIDEILAFKISSIVEMANIQQDSGLYDYLYYLISGMTSLITSENKQEHIENIVNCQLDNNNYSDWSSALIDSDTRQNMIDSGNKFGEDFLNSIIPLI